MKKHFVIFVLIFMITIGFATLNTVLDITGFLSIAENIEDFKIEITDLKINNESKLDLIAKDKESFTFTGSGNDTLEYTVTNYSFQYDANISLICTPSDNITVEQIDNLPAQSKNSKGITSTNTSEITCTINVEKISRTDHAEDMCLALEGTEWDFDYTGTEQEFIAPCDGKYKVELWGAQGGGNTTGGYGGYVAGNIAFNRGISLFLHIGNKPSLTEIPYNGGGITNNSHYPSYNGGGATDIRTVNGTWNSFSSLKSRIMVASSGGGFEASINGSQGGFSGGLKGYDGNYSTYSDYYIPTGASQISGGYGDNSPDWPGENGSFGNGGNGDLSYGGGGGGSGYYGGGGGGNANHVSSGAGGSSFISGHNGCDAISEESTESNIIHTGQPNHYSGLVFTDTVMVDGAGYNWTNVKGSQTGMPTHDGTGTMMGNSGNGYAKITYLGK